MHIPAPFQGSDLASQHRIIDENPICTLVAEMKSGIRISHLPVLREPLSSMNRPLHTSTLVGHMNACNPIAEDIEDVLSVTAIFYAPGAYISPTYHSLRPCAPTWNFEAVHLLARLEPLSTDDAWLVVNFTARELERRFGSSFSFASSEQYLAGLLPGVKAFRLHVTGIESMSKLSQDQPAEVRREIVDALRERDVPGGAVLAEAMSRAVDIESGDV